MNDESTADTLIGLISDTHGLLRPSVHPALAGVELILHAGDVGGHDILEELRTIAPVMAVYGNTDPAGDPELEGTLVIERGGVKIRVVHGHEAGRLTPEGLGAKYEEQVVIFGHTHRQMIVTSRNRLFVNPGAAGQRRFDLRPSVAKLTVGSGKASAEIIEID